MHTEDFSTISKHPDEPTVVFVGDSTSFSDMYCRLVQSELSEIWVTNVRTIAEAREVIGADGAQVHAVILSCRSGPEAISELEAVIEAQPSLRPVLAYQTMSEARAILQSINNRAFVECLSFLPLRARMDCTVTVLRLILSGERHVSGEVLDTLMEWRSEQVSEEKTVLTLTLREEDVIKQLAKGASNKVIARELKLAESTVKLHIHHIISKLGVSNRTEAAVAYVAGLAKLQNGNP